MADRKLAASFLPRRDTAATWEAKNPVLKNGEFITVITNSGTTRHKVGDGIKAYNQLPFEDEPLYNALAKKCDASEDAVLTLLAANWQNGQQTVAVKGLGAIQNGVIGLAQAISDAQYDAAVAAELRLVGQTEDSVTIACNGDVPQIDIPIAIILLG